MILTFCTLLCFSANALWGKQRSYSKHATELRAAAARSAEQVIGIAKQSTVDGDITCYDQNRSYFLSQMARAVSFPKEPTFNAERTLFYETAIEIFATNAHLLHETEIKIPKKIHQVWIGSEPPREVLKLAKTVKKCHPDFEYKLWRDSDLAEFGLDTAPLFLAAPNWGEKADILRYCILHKYGGVYLDMDIACYTSIEPLMKGIDFFAGIPDFKFFEIANGVIGCVPRHPIMERMLKNLIPANSFEGRTMGTVERTGPLLFTRIITQCWHEGIAGDVLIFPINYFYSLRENLAISYLRHFGHGWWSKPERINKLVENKK